MKEFRFYDLKIIVFNSVEECEMGNVLFDFFF